MNVKIILLLLVISLPISAGATSYYYQQQVNRLNSQVALLDHDSTNRSALLNGHVDRLTSQVSQLLSENSGLSSNITRLENKIELLTKEKSEASTTETSLVSQGQLPLTGYGAVSYINFTVPLNTITATLNISFTGVEFGV